MKRFALILAAIVLSVAALFALLVVLLPREGLKTRVGEQIAAWTGRDVSLHGDPEIHIFPTLSVTLNDVRVGGPDDMTDAGIVSMDSLTGTIKLLPLVIGRIEIGRFTMMHPLVHLVRDENGRRNWAFDSGAAALQLAFAGDVPLGNFDVHDGTILFEDRGSGDSERLDSVNLSVEWSTVRKPLSIGGSAIWRGEQVTVSGTAKAPFSFINGGATAIDARLDSTPIAMIFSGQADGYPRPRLQGSLKLSTPSLRQFVSWLGMPVGPGSTLGQASLFGTAAYRDRTLSMDDGELTLDGNNASGAVKIVAAETPQISGTLAFDSLDLSPYFTSLSAPVRAEPDWRRARLATDWLRNMSVDVRLSARSLKLEDLTASAAAASMSLRDARLEIGIAKADFDTGSLSGDISLTDAPDKGGATAEARMRATGISLAEVGPLIGLPADVTGTASAMIDVTTAGGDYGELVSGLTGTAKLGIEDGAVPLFGVAEIGRGQDAAADAPPERMLRAVPVNAASAGFSFSGGVGLLQRATLATTTYHATAQGWIGLLDGTLGINGELFQGAAAKEDEQGVPFTIQGTLVHPLPTTEPTAVAQPAPELAPEPEAAPQPN